VRLGLALALSLALAAAAHARPVVILLSFDGVRHDYLDQGRLPAFERIAREGARAEALVPVFPSTTFPSHVSLATGAPPDVHGIVANAFVDAKLGAFDYGNDARFLDAEPLWAAAERQGVPAAVFFWVGSETDWRGVGARHRMTPFDGRVGEEEKVAQILAWLDLPEPERPGLVMAWWHGADHAGHEHGPDADRTREALREQDRILGTLLAGLDARNAWPETTLLIVSDHGMTAYARTVDVRAVLAEAGVRTRRVIHALATAQVHLAQPEDAPRAAAALRAVPGVSAWPRAELPAALRYRHARVGDVVALAEPPLALLSAGSRGARFGWLARLLGRSPGAHGYDPAEHPAMHGIFVALGRGVPKGARLPRVRALDVAPTVAGLLGIAPPAQCEGAPIPLEPAEPERARSSRSRSP
jgi:arylsulfatase A-like enzyme